MTISNDHAIRGRGRNSAGRQPITNRSAVSCGAEKLPNPILIATNARPQITEVRQASAISRGRMAPICGRDRAS